MKENIALKKDKLGCTLVAQAYTNAKSRTDGRQGLSTGDKTLERGRGDSH